MGNPTKLKVKFVCLVKFKFIYCQYWHTFEDMIIYGAYLVKLICVSNFILGEFLRMHQ